MLTPETLVRHELVGLHVRVAESTDPTLVGCAGEVVRETMRTLSVAPAPEGQEGVARVRQVPKAACVFEFRLDDDGDEYVTVDGERLVARPARRTEQRGVTTWQ